MTNIKKVPGRMPYVTRFKHLDQQRRNVQRALNTIPAGSDEQTKVSNDDTTAGFLEAKLTQGTGITLSTLNPGADESLEISATAVDELVSVTATDTPGYLDTKINGVGEITVGPGGVPGTETLEISFTEDVDDVISFTASVNLETIQASWVNKYIRYSDNGSGANTVSVVNDILLSNPPIGSTIIIELVTTNSLRIVQGAGVTLNTPAPVGTHIWPSTAFSVKKIKKVGANEWTLIPIS